MFKPKRSPGRANGSAKYWKLAVAAASFAVAYLLVTQAIRASTETQQYLVTTVAVASGTTLTNAVLTTTELNLGASAPQFLGPQDEGDTHITLAALPAGAPIPRWLLATASDLSQGNLVLSPAAPLASDLSEGSAISIWVASRAEANRFQEPVMLTTSAELVAVLEETDPFSGANQQVEVAVPIETLSPLLLAIANRDQVFVMARGGNFVRE